MTKITSNTTKTILFASLIAATILSFGMTGSAQSVEEERLIEKQADPKEFVGDYKTEVKKIGGYFHVTHKYSSDGLTHLGVDHVFREEIHPIPSGMTQGDIDELIREPFSKGNYRMSLVHGDDVSTFDKIKEGDVKISAQAFQQWEIAKMERGEARITNADYQRVSHVEDWASKRSGHAYLSYDPINLVWSDTAAGSTTLLSKVDSKMSDSGWNDRCISTDLYINVNGTWTAQDRHYIDHIGGLCNQYHIRAWEINGNSVVGSAHEEDTKFKFPWDRIDIQHISSSGPNYTEFDIFTRAGFYHSLGGFESAEEEAAGEFTGGCWNYASDSHHLGNEYTRKTIKNGVVEDTAYNNGRATVITCS